MKKAIFLTLTCLVLSFGVNAQTNNAYGDNMKQVEPGTWAIFSGDINQDGVIDFFDLIDLDNGLTNFDTGYLTTDLTGDGVVDFFDLIILDNNLTAFVAVFSPANGNKINAGPGTTNYQQFLKNQAESNK